MKYAMIADIHANLAALQTVLAAIDEIGVDRTICLGDVVGYNASPGECIDIVVERGILCLSGNHDRYVAEGAEEGMRPDSKIVIEWTREQLNEDQIAWLKKLPDQHTLDREYLLVHGSPSDRDEYMLKSANWKRNLKEMKNTFFGLDLCFFAHTHYPMVISRSGAETDIKESRTIELKRREITLINPGSVGQPRDSCPLASFCVFDPGALTLDYHRVEYDVEATREKVFAAKLPRKNAERLTIGR